MPVSPWVLSFLHAGVGVSGARSTSLVMGDGVDRAGELRSDSGVGEGRAVSFSLLLPLDGFLVCSYKLLEYVPPDVFLIGLAHRKLRSSNDEV